MTKILSPLQSNFLKEIFQQTQEFYLTGGTALSAFYLKHRYSEDIDLFTHENFAFQMAEDLTNQICSKLNVICVPVRITSVFKDLRIGSKDTPLTIHFALEKTPQIKSPNSFGGILVDSIEDIITNKICAALGRTEIKDLIDLYFLDKAGYKITDYFNLAQQKDMGLSEESLAYTLSQFYILDIPAFVIKPLTVDELKKYVETIIEWLIRNSSPPSM